MNTSKTILQVPISKALRDKAAQVAADMGFTSLQEAVRLLINQLAKGTLSFRASYNEPDEILTPKQEEVLNRKYEQARKDIDAGRGITSHSVDELIAYLEKEPV
jgi:antitoxin component of RelBE/YafQ-DinJ toxin-antitoxin module